MDGDGELQIAHKLIRELQFEVDSLKKRIEVLELENARLSTSLSDTQKMYDDNTNHQILQDGEILLSNVGESGETNQLEKRAELDILGPSQCKFSFPSILYGEGNDSVISQNSSFKGIEDPGLPNEHGMQVGHGAIKLMSGVQKGHGTQQESVWEQVNMDNEPLKNPSTVSGQTEAEVSLRHQSTGFQEVSDIQVDHKRKKRKDKKKRGWLEFFKLVF
eukprot:Gb_19669 [translate_table: standard]